MITNPSRQLEFEWVQGGGGGGCFLCTVTVSHFKVRHGLNYPGQNQMQNAAPLE